MMPGVQFEEVWNAFLAGYDPDSLQRMLRFRLNTNLYTIVATDTTGRTGQWKPFSTPTSLPVIVDEALGDVPTKG